MLQTIDKICFIKLGSKKDNIESFCLDNGLMVLGYHGINHFNNYQFLNKESLQKEIIDKYKSDKGAATRHANQIMSFYDKADTTLWITFSQKKFGGDLLIIHKNLFKMKTVLLIDI